MCTKMLILISPHPNVCIPCVEVRQKETNIALSIPLRLLNMDIFGPCGLEFCQKMWICMLNLVMLITHFYQNLKYLHFKCMACPLVKRKINNQPQAIHVSTFFCLMCRVTLPYITL